MSTEKNLTEFCYKYLELTRLKKEFVVVTLSHIRGSAPQNLGAKMIVSLDDILFGTVGGGKVEKYSIDFSRGMLSSQNKKASSNKSQTWNLRKELGMNCGGEVSVLFEAFTRKTIWNIVIFGAGHISQALSRVLLNLDCNITIIETRKKWLDKLPSSSRLKKIETKEMASALTEISPYSFVLLMTMGHKTDLPILQNALKDHQFPFLGVIGSPSKRNALEKELVLIGVDKEKIGSFHCPVGEDFGDNSPGEIAVSITAQLIKHKESWVS